MQLRKLASSALVAGALMIGLGVATAAEPENTVILTLKNGDVTIGLRPDLAPKHVEQIKALVAEGAYDNVAFHRVIDGFMAQTGDVQFGDVEDGFDARLVGTGGSEKPDLPAEFSDADFARGTVGMARSQDPNSANSQFFIMFAPASHLNGQYTVIGEVESGMELVDKIKKGDSARNGMVQNPDKVLKARMASDSAN
ncbi:peptidylprolyl isomerase [Nitratireductor aquimarinus]|uniref:Peptidyl-prolyl cis-trans isomerase n=2 Tax=Alphaproteobacteria TaxID=28211 RepID=A0ABU4AKX3_9HYPH|nr:MULTISPECIES: peptidylprolyl isomerase [Nitratireductor]MBY6021095.1 peptidylprolyl isomerase [Nitratireductor sp. DP7N14-4]MBN7756309.1 peptidylprolyl isomerase [Nitratireductor aquimarinus]MBN7759893.1 peptidylprolyl isomerase [Nitratireductor aquibiodomus]MBN7776696.1 peptidylprolyl isomerase [Nitratireductor pacificus]MBN7780030.1 peptidylprolyl isomerase [Nitratireductor pacificus]